MECLFCSGNTKVTDKRPSPEGIRRRRECLKCKKRFTTYEKPRRMSFYVIKKDGHLEKFNREKLQKGLERAFEKRPFPKERIAALAEGMEEHLMKKGERQVKSSTIGELIMSRLKKIDNVAYIRFASVYRDFQDVKDFKKEMKRL